MTESPTDRELVDGCIAGNRRSWDLFVDRFSGLVHWSIARTFGPSVHIGRRDILEDVFQEVFRKLVEKDELLRLRDVKYLRKFLAVTACHTALDYLKSLSRRERGSVSKDEPLLGKTGDPTSFMADTLASSSVDPREAAQNRESDAIVAESIRSLLPRERACVEMHYIDGRTHREISEILAIPQDTVSTVIRRSRDKLKDELLKKGFIV